jgi:hypothetical protein
MRRRYLRGFVVATVAVGLAVSATGAIAGTGINAILNLGRTNKVNQTTVLQGSTTSRLLQVTNTGTGPALQLTVKAGKAPMAVNSEVKVTHLNADLLDGLDSSAFRKVADPVDAATLGGLHSSSFRKVADPVDAATLGGISATGFVQTGAGVVQSLMRGRLTEPLNSGNAAILAVPGFGSIEASCGSGGFQTYRLFWRNTSGGPADVWFSDASTVTTYVSAATGGGAYVAPVDGSADRTVTVMEGLPSGAVATVTVSAHAGPGGCVFYAQAIAG